MATKYTFETTSTYDVVHHAHESSTKQSHRRGHHLHHHHHRRTSSASSDPNSSDHGGGGSGDPLDCSGSLTYSAASSINSGCGESTDSSFADIIKVLEIQDGTNLASFLRGGGGSSSRRDEKSVAAESLAYSTDADTYLRSLATDADSHLHGTDLLSQAYGGSASDRIPPSNGEREDPAVTAAAAAAPDAFADDIFFAPAEHTESIKQRKERKRQERQQRRASRGQGSTASATSASSSSPTATTPMGANHSSPRTTSIHVGTRSSSQQQQQQQPPPPPVSSQQQPRYSQSLDSTTDAALQWESRQEPTPPPRPPKSRTTSSRGAAAAAPNSQNRRKTGKGNVNENYDCNDDDDVWYAKWWVFCFPDAVRNMTERR